MTEPATSPPAQAAISPAQPLILMHIPKTGGMSLFTALAERFGTAIADLYNVSPRNAQAALRAFADPSMAVYCGHYAFGVHEWLNRPASYAAVVREPVKRLVSLYHYCQPMLRIYRQRLQKADGSMEALWRNPRLSDFYLDFEATLRGDDSPEAFFAGASAELDNGMVRRFSGWGLNPQRCPAAALETAKANIERHFSVVGVLERYPETLQMMARTFGMESLRENKVNTGKPESKREEAELPAEILERIRAANPLDLALYDWVCARFDAALQAPPRLVTLPGGGRQDAAGIPLWRSVGNSPLREIALKTRGSTTEPTQFWQMQAILRASHSRQMLRIDAMVKNAVEKGAETDFEQVRLLLSPPQAEKLMKTLGSLLESFRKHHPQPAQPAPPARRKA